MDFQERGNLPPVDFSSSEGSELNSSSSETGDTSTEDETILRGRKRVKRSRSVFNYYTRKFCILNLINGRSSLVQIKCD